MKGFTLDITLIIMMVFVIIFVVSIFIANKVWFSLKDSLPSGSIASDAAIVGTTMVTTGFDYTFFLVFMGIGIASWFSAFLIRTHPVFAIISIFLLIVIAFTSPMFANMYDSIVSTGSFSDMPSTYPLLNLIMRNFPFWMIAIDLVTMGIMYSKTGGGGEGL